MIPHLVTCRQFTRYADVCELLDLADRIPFLTPTGAEGIMRGKIAGMMFGEPSLRTRWSFEAATIRLGGSVISESNATANLSLAKGESLEDTIRTASASYVDLIVLRHREPGAAERAAAVSSVPIINAGDGDNEHPTQALLDIYTLRRELNHLDNLKIALVGDLKHSRTIHSLIYLLALCQNPTLILTAPALLQLPADHRAGLEAARVNLIDADSLGAAVDCQPDAVYMTRLQAERRADEEPLPDEAWDPFCMNSDLLAKLSNKAAILHPGPRGRELPPALDGDRKVAMLRQTVFGTVLRMAVLARIFARPGLFE